MAGPNKNSPPAGEPDRKQMMRVLIPAGIIALVVIVAAIVAAQMGGGRKMSDGSDGSADDPDLKEVAPGVKIRDLKVGEGPECPHGADVKMNYTGWRTDGHVFDSSQKQGKPLDRPLGKLIHGWQLGVPGMKVGGVRKLVVAPDKAYGDRIQPDIPPGSTLIFEIELLAFTPQKDTSKLSDGTKATDDDPNLKPLGSAGLMYRDLKVGDGPECPAGAHVVMNYTGWLKSNGKVFDSSQKPGGKPLDMSLKQLIAGWQQGVPGMKVGGVRKLLIPAELGYGADGFPPDIPPGATLVFEIELLGVK
jgi:peptidylprolyl isomerase